MHIYDLHTLERVCKPSKIVQDFWIGIHICVSRTEVCVLNRHTWPIKVPVKIRYQQHYNEYFKSIDVFCNSLLT